MIHVVDGNLLESKAEALVNAVNTVGVMGKGIALQFKNQFPNNFKIYAKACKEGLLHPGKLLVTTDESIFSGKKIIINLPTKTHWRKPSEYTYVEEGLEALVLYIQEHQISSVAIPALGAGNGGLEWSIVLAMMQQQLESIECEVFIYKPS